MYDISQPTDHDETRRIQFRKDLGTFLELETPLQHGPGTGGSSHQKRPEGYVELNICKPKYKQLRSILMEISVSASTWITEYFMNHPDVMISSPDQFRHILETSWKVDPCDAKEDEKAPPPTTMERSQPRPVSYG